MTDTKPGKCPFPDCKGKGIAMVLEIAMVNYHRVICSDVHCNAHGPTKSSEALAIAAWDAPTEKIERLEEALRKIANFDLVEWDADEIDEMKDIAQEALSQQEGGE